MLAHWLLGAFAVLVGPAQLACGETCAADRLPYYTLHADEHKPACFFHAVKHTECPTDDPLLYVAINTVVDASTSPNGDLFLVNGTTTQIALDQQECSKQFRTRLFLNGALNAQNQITLNHNPEPASVYEATYPYILVDGKYVQGATLNLTAHSKNDGLQHALYLIHAIAPLVSQSEQPHGIRPSDEGDDTLLYVGFGTAGVLFLLVLLLLVFTCQHTHREPEEDCVSENEKMKLQY